MTSGVSIVMQSQEAARAAEQVAREVRTAVEAATAGNRLQGLDRLRDLERLRELQLPPEATRGGPQAIYRGYERMREELRSQLKALQDQREEISGELQNPMVSGSNRAGLSKRLEAIDGRIAAIDLQIAEVDAAVARAGALPGVAVPSRQAPSEPPEAYVAFGVVFMLCAVLPISIAFARRIWRRGAAAATEIPKEIIDRLSRLDQNLDTVALEVERIGEGQRFLTRAFAEQQRGLSAGPAERVETAREKELQRRGS